MKTLTEIKALVGALPAGGLPIALLPVHVQTRFVTRDGAPQLLVRVYPDEVHLDGHDTALTAAEIEWGRRYWELIWPAAADKAALRRAWDALAERFGSRRAAWVARRLTPTNLAARPATPPAFGDVGVPRSADDSPAVQARALPDRWVVLGYRAGDRVLLEAGAPIPESLTVSPGSDGPPPEADGDPRMRWMTDFAEAERVGMGIRVGLTAFEPLDRLLVLGVKASQTAEAATARLESLLDGHHYTRGFSLLAPGTPTNNTAEADSGYTKRDEGGFEVEAQPPRMPNGADGIELSRLLGIKRDLLTSVEGATRLEDATARRLQTALWPVTGRYYLDQLLRGERPFSDAELDAAKQFFVGFVRSQGPFGVLRIGRQPYGLVPAMSLDLLGDQSRLVRTLRGLRGAWRSALGQVPRLLPDSADERRLVEILRTQPVSVGVRARPVVDHAAFALGGALPVELEQDLAQHANVLRGRLRPLGDLAMNERLLDALPARGSAPLTAPAAGDIKGLRTATFDALLAEQPETLLRALLRHSLLLAQATLAQRRLAPGETYREPALVDVRGPMEPTRVQTLLRGIDRDPALRASIHTAPELEELRSALQFLETVPQDALARHLAGVLDLFAYRLDAWVTGLATRRLNELRRQTPRGLALGGFGWVEDLVPDPQAPVRVLPPGEQGPLLLAREDGGAIHAPSMPQASAAAVLRSGYLNEPSSAFAVDLRSERVRLAQFLLDGVREGQPLSELLGYRFERALHEHGLDRYLLGFRRASQLPALVQAQHRLEVVTAMGGIGSPVLQAEAMQMIEAALVAARARLETPPTASVQDVLTVVGVRIADGLELARMLRAGTVPYTQLGAPVSAAERAQLEVLLRELDAAIDALGDALTAEGVYQAVRGSAARAAASVDALAHGDIQPPELEVVQTPQQGAAVTHRLLALFCATPAPAPLTGVRGVRALAEPALELWLRQMLGDLRHVLYAVDYLDASGAVLLRRDKQPLGTLVAAPTDALYMSTAELLALLEHGAWKTAPAKAVSVRLLADRQAGMAATLLSLTEFLELLRAFRDVVLGARALDANDVAVPGERVPPAVDADELAARANAAVAALRQARQALTTADERLVDFLFLGFPEVLPARADRVPAVLAEADRRLAAVEAMTIDRAAAAPEAQVEFDQERLRTVFGPAFRALPLVRPGNLAELGNSLRRSDELQGGDPLQAHSWLQGAGRVRPGASRLGTALSYASALGRATELKVAQLPFAAGERWIGLAGATPPPGKVSLVAHLPRPFQPTAPLSGLVLDEWVEVVPSRDVTTGLAFNYDAPGARAPQSILLAVAPPGTAKWEVETLEATLLETLELAKLRAVDPQALGGDALAQRALPAVYVPTNLAGEEISTDFRKLANA